MTHEEPMEHLWPASAEYVRWDDRAETLRREYRAGLRVGLIKGMVAGVVLAPALWFTVMWLGA